jgi:teichuronic acid biosynthesis glycosyltransferase TuaC
LTVLRIATLSSLYPSEAQPGKGVFIENRTVHLHRYPDVEIRVVAPVPWFPLRSRHFGMYASFARVPMRDARNGLSIEYPRYLVIPKVGMSLAPALMAHGILRTLKNLIASGYEFDVIDAYYFYPDGIAAALVGKWLNKPVVINALGTDVNVIPDYRIPRAWIKWAADNAAAITTVSKALKEQLVILGVGDDKIHINRHGVDHAQFAPPRTSSYPSAREQEKPRTLLCVGNLLEAKGQQLAIESLLHLKDFRLLLVGKGKNEPQLRQQVSNLELTDRVEFVGHVDHAKLVTYYCSSDALILPSEREGIPNVIMESLACGTPVIATNVGGIPEIISSKIAGVLIDERTPQAIVDAVHQLFSDYPSTRDVVQFSKQFTWAKTTEDQVKILRRAVSLS